MKEVGEWVPGPTLSKTKETNENSEIRSHKYLRPEVRFKFHVTQVLYNTIDMAEEQVQELLDEVKELKKENKRLNMLYNSNKRNRYE